MMVSTEDPAARLRGRVKSATAKTLFSSWIRIGVPSTTGNTLPQAEPEQTSSDLPSAPPSAPPAGRSVDRQRGQTMPSFDCAMADGRDNRSSGSAVMTPWRETEPFLKLPDAWRYWLVLRWGME